MSNTIETLVFALKTLLPAADDNEQDARLKAKSANNLLRRQSWENVADCYKADADKARAAIALAEKESA